jgi:hypothetical protein
MSGRANLGDDIATDGCMADAATRPNAAKLGRGKQAFGEAVASLYDRHENHLQRWASRGHNRAAARAERGGDAQLISVVSQVEGGWGDAALDHVFAVLERRV